MCFVKHPPEPLAGAGIFGADPWLDQTKDSQKAHGLTFVFGGTPSQDQLTVKLKTPGNLFSNWLGNLTVVAIGEETVLFNSGAPDKNGAAAFPACLCFKFQKRLA